MRKGVSVKSNLELFTLCLSLLLEFVFTMTAFIVKKKLKYQITWLDLVDPRFKLGSCVIKLVPHDWFLFRSCNKGGTTENCAQRISH